MNDFDILYPIEVFLSVKWKEKNVSSNKWNEDLINELMEKHSGFLCFFVTLTKCHFGLLNEIKSIPKNIHPNNIFNNI